uniref:NAD-dependent epimerase/dehydratase n=1 Tax=Cyanothece sp. (strain PCC 7425 / ATCC 29141) TaxID=395961 RepID=B8HN71_CYAP4
MKVLILGCGYTGSRLARFLQSQAIPVQGTTRSGMCPLEVEIPCFAFSSDVAAQTSLNPIALEGATHVLTTIPPNEQGNDPIVQSLLPQLEQLARQGTLQWFGYLSTTGVYGDTGGAWVDETSPLQPQNQRSQHRVKTETTLLNSALPTHIFRLPGIYGPGRSVFERIRSGTAQRIDRPGHVFSRIHVDDIVQTLWRSMLQPACGEIYNVSDDEPCEPADLITLACELLSVQPPEWIPYHQVKLSPMAASFWSECRRVENYKIKNQLGVKLLYPTYREGLQAILADEG